MIAKFGSSYKLVCDVCGESEKEEFDDFYEAVDFKKEKGNEWRSKKVGGDWIDVCEDCGEKK